MLLAVVYDVDVMHDWFDKLALVAGLGGFIAAVVAIWLARRAQFTADNAITDERRRVFELEILRELTKDLDGGLASNVFIDPGALRVYELRLSLVSTRLPFWDAVASLKDRFGVAAAVGLPEYKDVELGRSKLNDEQEVLSSLAPSLLVIPAQPPEAQANMLEKLKPWADPAPAGDDKEAWVSLKQDLYRRLKKLEDDAPKRTDRYVKLQNQVKLELRRKLAYDVEQAIWSRVEARPHSKVRWWNRG